MNDYWGEKQEYFLNEILKPFPVVVWVGNNAHDKLMLAMLASIVAPSVDIKIVDIEARVNVGNYGYSSLSKSSPEVLLDLKPISIDLDLRKKLSAQWTC